jgi:hypothetical protein
MAPKAFLKDAYAFLCLCTITLALTPHLLAQVLTETTAGTAAVRIGVVPPVVRYAGTASNRAGDAVEAVFSIYAAQEGGDPLWSETQHVFVGLNGKYSILLGSASLGGIPGQSSPGAKVAGWV